MSKPQWIDTASYGHSGGPSPESWELRIEGLHITVHRIPTGDPHQWYGTCAQLGLTRKAIGFPGESLADAQSIFLWLVAKHVDKLQSALFELTKP